MFIGAFGTVSKNWKPKYLSLGECINKLQHTHTMAYYPGMK